MKNIRKIVAILAAVLMFCSVLPLSAFADDGDVVLSLDFEDEVIGFSDAEIVADGDNHYLKWTASGGWSSTWTMLSDVQANTDYTVTFKAKGSVAGGMGTTLEIGSWGAYWNGPSFDVTTDWAEYTLTFNSASYVTDDGKMMFKFQDVALAMDLYVDDLVIAEGLPKIPLCENGDFESGDANWLLSQSSVVDATAAHSGSLGAHLIGGANWNSMLERTFTVGAGKTYELSFWAKTVSGGSNIKFLDQNWQGAALASGIWFTSTEWTKQTVLFTALSDVFYFQFCGAGSVASELYVDDVTLIEIKDPSFDGYIYNGDFEIGKVDFGTNEVNTTGAWVNLWGSSSVELVEGYNGDYALKGTASGDYNQVYQPVAVTPNTNYTVVCYSKDSTNSSLWIKNSAGQGDLTNTALNSGSDWGLTSLSFNSGSNSVVWVGLMGISGGATYTVDDVVMFEAAEQSNDGYLVNGTFETGAVTPWDNLWGSCPKAEIAYGGYNDNFSIDIVSGEWLHVRQTNIAVEANTDYKISLWAKNVKNMNLLVKDNGDSDNLNNKSIEGGAEWTYNEFTFNTGDYTSIIVSLMGGAAEAYGQFDNIVMEKVAVECAHEYAYDCSKVCSICGEETRPEAEHAYFYPCDPVCMICYELTNEGAAHNIVAVEAVEATCTENGNIAYWYCADCGAAWADEALTQVTNRFNVIIAAPGHEYYYACDAHCMNCGEETNPDAAHNVTHVEAKAAVSCIEYGNREYWYCDACGTAWLDVNLIRQTNQMAVRVAGECVSDAEFACQDGVCVNCGLPCYAEAEHEYDDEYDADCNVCGDVREVPDKPVEDILYGDADGDGEVTLTDAALLGQYLAGYDVTVDEVAADADGDGEVTLTDAALLGQYLAGYDVTLGPAQVYNDGVLGGW